MRAFKPGAINQYLATLPEEYQKLAIQAIIDEHNRWERGDLTPEERESQEMMRRLGRQAAQTVDNVFLKCLNKRSV
jgi:hypothetical protein